MPPEIDVFKLAEALLTAAPGAAFGAAMFVAWWQERRMVQALQTRLYRLAVAGLAAKKDPPP